MEETMVNLDEIFQYLIGEDEDGDQRSVIDVSLLELDDLGHFKRELLSFTALETIVNKIKLLGAFAMAELDFGSINNSYLLRMKELMQRFQGSNTEKTVVVMTISNLLAETDQVLVLVNPLICVQGYSEKSGQTSLLQMVFDLRELSLVENTVDLEMIRSEVAREFEAEEEAFIENPPMIEEAWYGSYEETYFEPFKTTDPDAQEVSDPYIRHTKEW